MPPKKLHRLFGLLGSQPESLGDLASVKRLVARRRIDRDLDDLLGMLGRDFLDLHPAFGRGHHHDLRDRAIDDDAQVKLLGDVGAFFDPDFVDFLSVRAGLRSHESLADDFLSGGLDGREIFADFHAARFAAPAGMNLSLHHPNRVAALFLKILRGLFSATRDVSALFDESPFGNPDAVFLQKLLA